jgi:hypothetical protein
MKARCLNPRHEAWANYGGRGIKICDEWIDDYDQFVADMGIRPAGTTLDREDNDGDYTPGNCRWADLETQHNNRRDNTEVEHHGVTMNLSQWAKALGIKPDTLLKRLERMPIARALTPTSLRPVWRHGTRHGYAKGCRCRPCRDAHAAHHRAMRATRRNTK